MGAFILFTIIGILIVGVVAYFGWQMEEKRRQALAATAMQLGLGFSSERNPTLASQLHFLDRLARGSNRYCYNVLSGRYRDQDVMVLDYHYETYSSSKNGRKTHHHYYNITLLTMPAAFPELQISPENFFDKIASGFGFGDIDFESAEFSRKFKVHSDDKKFEIGRASCRERV